MVVKKEYFYVFLIIDLLILVIFDSIYCQKDTFLILYGCFIQLFYFVLFFSCFLDDIDFLLKLKEKVPFCILILGSFLLLKNGSLGTDITGRTTQCPNTWLLYLKDIL